MPLQKYKIVIEQVTQLTKWIEANCNEIMFVNLSTTDTVTVANFPIPPQGFLSIDGNADEIDTTTYRVVQPTIGDCWVVRKVYVKK